MNVALLTLALTVTAIGTQPFHEGEKALEDTLSTVVVTGTRTPKLLRDVPVLTRIITGEELARVDATHIDELLQQELPGIEFTYSMNQQQSINMQGFGGNSVLFLVDGERMAGETLDNIDYSRLDMNNIARVEILRGAASSLYGSNAVGGVINLIPKTSTAPFSANASVRYGSHDSRRYGAVVSAHRGAFTAEADLLRSSVGEIDLGGAGDISKIYANASGSAKGRLIWTPSDRLRLTGRGGYFLRQRFESSALEDRYRDYSAGLKANCDFDGRNSLEAAYSFDRYDKSAFLPGAGTDTRNYSNVQHTLRGTFSSALDWGTLTAGGDAVSDYLMSYQFEGGRSFAQWDLDAYAQMEVTRWRGLDIIAALRYDYFTASQSGRLSPKLGLLWKPAKALSLRASYAQGFRAPTLKEMYMQFNMSNIFMIYGNPALRPEVSDNFSLSQEWSREVWSLALTEFYNDVSGRITTVWNAARRGMEYVNTANLQVFGGTAELACRFPWGLSARASYAYTKELIANGHPLFTTTRPHSATFKIDYGRRIGRHSLSATFSGRCMSSLTADEYVSSLSYEQTERKTYPGYSIWKLSATAGLWSNVRLTAAIDNLFNYRPDYYYANSPATVGRTFSIGLAMNIMP